MRIKGANREVSEGKADLITTVCFLPTRANKERRTGKNRGAFFKDAQGFGRLDTGSLAGFTSSRPQPPWTSVLQFSLFLHDVCGLENLGLADQNRLERDLSALLLRTLAVGTRQESEWIEVALDME